MQSVSDFDKDDMSECTSGPDYNNKVIFPNPPKWAEPIDFCVLKKLPPKAQRKLVCYEGFSKSYEFLNIFVGLIHSNLHTTHTIIDNHT